jgi:hypothetical protein
MIKTAVDLYRRGNATSPRMDHVRPNKDIAIYENNGQIWVKKPLSMDKHRGEFRPFPFKE